MSSLSIIANHRVCDAQRFNTDKTSAHIAGSGMCSEKNLYKAPGMVPKGK